MRFSGIIFDFDLTLADSSEAIIRCFKLTLEHFGYPRRSDRDIFDTIGKTLLDSFDILTGIPDNPQKEDMRKYYVSQADKFMASGTHFYPETLPLLDLLRGKGIKTAVVSSKMKYRIEETFLLHFGRVPVDLIIGLTDMPKPKPEPDGLFLAARELDLPAWELLYVGDSMIDAEAAQNAGINFAAVTTGPTPSGVFEKYPNVAVLSDIGKVAGLIENDR